MDGIGHIMNQKVNIFSKQNKIINFVFLVSFLIYSYNYSKNLVNYYYNHRIEKINGWNRTYNESNLLTFEDKMNWIAIHDVNKLKGRCSDKILLF